MGQKCYQTGSTMMLLLINIWSFDLLLLGLVKSLPHQVSHQKPSFEQQSVAFAANLNSFAELHLPLQFFSFQHFWK